MPRAYVTIEDFKAGLDTRRLATASAAGSLQVLQNAHINRGGEIVKAKKWSPKYALPPGTLGMKASAGVLNVFGSMADPGGFPAGVNYQQLTSPDGEAMTEVLDTENFSGKLYVLAEFGTGTTYHFFDETRSDDWYVGLVRDTQASLGDVAAQIAADIGDDPDVTASVVGPTITITAIEDNKAFVSTASATNGGAADDQTVSNVETTPASASVQQVNTVTLGGTFDPGDQFTVTVNDNIYGARSVNGEQAKTVITHKDKIYAGAGVNLHFSAIAAPLVWSDNQTQLVFNAGSGAIDIGAQAATDESITGLGIYQNNLAVFTRNSTQIWATDADPTGNSQLQVLETIGTRSPRTVKSFGDLDVFFLSEGGVRSLRARDSSNSASVTDVGTPIDDLIVATLNELTDAQVEDAVAAIEPRDGRYIMALDGTQFVFSFFATSKISAWSTYEPGVTMTDFTVLNGRLYGRAGDLIYLLGGDDFDEFTNQQVIVELPYLDARTIAHFKQWVGLDIIAEGVWDVFINTNPRYPDEWVKTATIDGSSIGELNFGMQQFGAVIKMKFEHKQSSGSARISKVIAHYEATWAG